MGCISCELLVGCGYGGGGRIHDDSSYRRDSVPNGDALRKCILKGPYTPTIVTTPAVPATEDSLAVLEQTTVETMKIYSIVDAVRLKLKKSGKPRRLTKKNSGESLNIQDVKTNLFWEFGQFTSHDGETIESYYTRFYKMMNEMIRNNLTVATMQKFQCSFLHNLQPDMVKICHNCDSKKQHKLDMKFHTISSLNLKTIPKEVNKLVLKEWQECYPFSTSSLPTRSHATTRYKGKEIAKPITPPSESASEEDSDPEQAQKDKDMQKNLALIAKYFKKLYKPTNNNLRTSSNTRNKNVVTTIRNAGKAKTAPALKTSLHVSKGKMLLCKQAEKGVQLQAEQSDWLADTDEEIDEQELEAHYSYMAKIQEVPNADSGTDSEPLEQDDQNDVECDDERVALANLIANLKLDVDENIKIQ
ncbi:hypothetical protein Tco_0242359 [Tanacetum coccineum]